MRISDWSSDVCSSDLGGFAQHDGLRIEPAPLIQQAAQLQTVHAVLLYGIFVMDAGNQAFVGNVQQGQSRGFVDAAAFCLDDAVFDLVAHAQAVAPANTRSEEHTSELQSLMRISYAVFCLKKKKLI